MEGSKTYEELRAELIGKAAADDGYRARLVEDPRAAIKEALGIELPESLAVHVHEETPATAHLVLPPSAGLTETDLEGIAAGHSKKGFYSPEGAEHHHRLPEGGWGPSHS